MRKTEKILGLLLITLMIIRLIFHYPILDTAIILLAIILSLIYFALSFALLNNVRLRKIFDRESYKGTGTLRIVGAVFTGFILSMITIYSLFKFMRWPFANQGLTVALISLIIPVVIVTVKLVMTKSNYYSIFLVRLLVFGIIGTLFYFTSTEKIFELKKGNLSEFVGTESN